MASDTPYAPIVIEPKYENHMWTLELSWEELSYITAILESHHKTKVSSRVRSQDATTKKYAALREEGKDVKDPTPRKFKSVVIQKVPTRR